MRDLFDAATAAAPTWAKMHCASVHVELSEALAHMRSVLLTGGSILTDGNAASLTESNWTSITMDGPSLPGP
eukprot:5530515-Pyramimonas_sp.AAC.1